MCSNPGRRSASGTPLPLEHAYCYGQSDAAGVERAPEPRGTKAAWRGAGAPAIQAMTRKTSFYYSFLVLPAAERRAITAVFDFCRAVDDAVDLEPDRTRAV